MKLGLPAKVSLLCILLLVMSLFSGMSFAATTISFTPENQEVLPNQIFPVDIFINNVDELVGYQFGLKYDPAIVAVQSINQGAAYGGFFSSAPMGSFEFSSGGDNVNGRIRFLIGSVLGLNSVSGSGLLARVNFKALTPGEADIYIPETLSPPIMETIFLGAGPADDPYASVKIPFTIANSAHVSVTPEPISCVLFVMGGAALASRRLFRKKVKI